MLQTLQDFFTRKSASGIVLLLVSVLAMVAANSPVAIHYETWANSWAFPINDMLMVVFFLLIGLEIKREIAEGELSVRGQAALPLVAALGGVVVPAIIYSVFNWGSDAMRGWAIPSATDVAFSLSVLALFGSRLAPSLRVFLMAVAVIDDLVAVIIIAGFYTEHLSPVALVRAVGCVIILWGFNRCVTRLSPFLFVGIFLWMAVVNSGVHATVAGVILAWMLPLPLVRKLIDTLRPWVAFGVMPIFAFANAGIPLAGLTVDKLMHALPMGIAFGLFFGKQFGIFAASWLLIRFSRVTLPAGASWLQFYGVCMIAGIGFTMSLFIGTLAFDQEEAQLSVRLGVMIGSLLSAIVGYMLLATTLRAKRI